MSNQEYRNGDTDTPLLSGNCDGCAGSSIIEYDEDGSLALARALGGGSGAVAASPFDVAQKPCAVGVLNGSWYLQLTPKGPHTLTEIRGPMRIEVAPPKLRISGDIYVRKPVGPSGPVEILHPITARPLLFGKNWYPQLPIEQYAWYFRSLGVTYNAGKLVFKFERTLWNKTTQEFINLANSGKDTGFIQLECLEGNIFTHPALPQPTLRLTGTAQVGGETYDAVATKTSPFYRGCAVEVDVMTNRSFPLSATTINGTIVDYASVYRTAGFDCVATVDQSNLANNAELTIAELQTALAVNRRPIASGDDAWRLWLMVGSSQGSLFGLMFDEVEPFREGTAGFFDPNLGSRPVIDASAQNKKLGEVAAAFLRTLVHESGHAFNLFHPKHDVHTVPIGTTIMNQTGDVMGFATETQTFPGNITFAFDDHNRTSLIHSPDPQVRPGWKRFGWGHGSLSSGIAEPVDAAGFLRDDHADAALALELLLPDVVFRGEFLTAQFVLTNISEYPRRVTSAINLSQGDLRLLLKAPAEELNDVRDVIIACGDRPFTVLEPGQSLKGNAQIFYTNYGFTFRQTGRHFISAELTIGDEQGSVARSGPVAIVVRAPATQEEEDIARLSLDTSVGRAFALGDYGTDEGAREKLEVLADTYGHTTNGIAAALTLANTQSRDLRDLYSGSTLRKADPKQAKARFDAAIDSLTANNPEKLVRLASGVAAPTENDAPVLELTADYLTKAAPAQTGAEADDAAAADVKPAARRRPGRASAAHRDALGLLQEIRRSFAQKS